MPEGGSRRDKILRIFIVLIVLVLIGTGGVFGYFYLFAGTAKAETGIVYDVVKRGVFVHEVTERGNVDSAQNEEIRCEVESPSGTLIIWIISEGEMVEKGTELCRLDSSALQEKVTQQEITVANNKASLAQSQADLNAANIALEEYTEGLFKQQVRTVENKILKAEEDSSRAKEIRGFTEKLLSQGYVTELQLRADIAKENQTQNDYEIAQLEKKVLKDFTFKKMVEQLNATIKTADAKVKSDERSCQIAEDRLRYYQTQVEKCTIYAPKAGQVVYATPSNPWRRDNEVIKEGNTVRERQTIIKLPDPRQMQVTGMVNEASVSLVKTGQPAVISLEAMPGKEFHGSVKSVSDYPEPDNMMGSMTKEYKTIVSIDDLDQLPVEQRQGIRPGLTAQVKINVSTHNDDKLPLLVPVQTLFEYKGNFYCVTYENGKWDKVRVEVGATNDKEVIIKSGLQEGTRIVQGAWRYSDRVIGKDEGLNEVKQFGVGGKRSNDKKGGPDAASGNASGNGGTNGGSAAGGAAGGDGASGDGAGAEGRRPRRNGDGVRLNPADLFKQLDKNGDGFVTQEETAGTPFAANFAAADTDGDGKVSLAELTAVVQKFAPQRGDTPGNSAAPGNNAPGNGENRPAGESNPSSTTPGDNKTK